MTLAFVDKGSKLTVETHNKAVIQDLIAIAKARDWQEIKVTGTETFRREVWKESYAAGLDVKGYKPSELELQAANKERVRRNGPNELSAKDRPPPGGKHLPCPPGRGTREMNPDGILWNARGARRRAVPERSHQIRQLLRDPQDEAGRERTHWGVGLAEAMKNAQTAPGVREIASESSGSASHP